MADFVALQNAFVEAGQYKINEDPKFEDDSIFQIKIKDQASREYPFKFIKSYIPNECFDIKEKTFKFTSSMSKEQFNLGILFWGSKKSLKRREDGAHVYYCEIAVLLANLDWINKEIGNIHILNNGPPTQ